MINAKSIYTTISYKFFQTWNLPIENFFYDHKLKLTIQLKLTNLQQIGLKLFEFDSSIIIEISNFHFRNHKLYLCENNE